MYIRFVTKRKQTGTKPQNLYLRVQTDEMFRNGTECVQMYKQNTCSVFT